jgi:CBS domain-containing protein
MRSTSIFLGRYFGIELRLHSLFALLLPVMALLSGAIDGSAMRGIVLWILLLAAVLVRETGRGIASAVAGLSVNRLLLLPTGAVQPADEEVPPTGQWKERLIALSGPLANFVAGITMALLMYSATPGIKLFQGPLFGPSHLLRSAIWAQVLLGGLNLIPAYPLDAGVMLRNQLRRVRGADAGRRASAGISQVAASVLIVLGAAFPNAWLVIMGCSILLSTRAEAQSALASSASGNVRVSDVMLTDFTTLHASETLEEAVHRSVRSLQDVFPVVRGTLIVGAISRDALMAALRTGGNGYVQSAMTRTVEVTHPDDLLMPTLRRVQHSRGAQLLPVLQDDRVVGIVTPGNLSHSMSLLGRTRRVVSRGAVVDRDA